MRIMMTLFIAALSMASQANAQSSNFYIRTDPAMLMLSEDAKIYAGGTRIPGASIGVDPHVTGTLEIGYSFTKNFSIGFTGGFPPSIDIDGKGTAAAFGKLGEVTYGPTALTAQYTFTNFGAIQPYVGVGPMFMFLFENKDSALTNLKVDPAIGAVVQAGIDFNVTDRWGLYVDVKKAYLRTSNTGSLGGMPISADVKLDPFVVGGGIKFRF